MKRIYILGAGSSIGHSKGSFPSITGFFSSAKQMGCNSRGEFKLVTEYARKILGRNIFRKKDTTNIEAFLTHIEIELERSSLPDLLEIRQKLLQLIRFVLITLEKNIPSQQREYHDLVSRLGQTDTIISFNWDLLLDNALNRESILKKGYQETYPKQYWEFIRDLSALGEQMWKGISVESPYRDWEPDMGRYLKVHGSVDWFYCSNESCRGLGKVFPTLEPMKIHYCSECHEPLKSLLIPPVLNKQYRSYPFIRRIWNVAANEVGSANELIIWGYSLPSTDFYSSWLLRQARRAPLQRLIIINPSVVNWKYRLKANFVRRFYGIFRDKIEKESLSLYDSFESYCNGPNILEKCGLGDPEKAYKGI